MKRLMYISDMWEKIKSKVKVYPYPYPNPFNNQAWLPK